MRFGEARFFLLLSLQRMGRLIVVHGFKQLFGMNVFPQPLLISVACFYESLSLSCGVGHGDDFRGGHQAWVLRIVSGMRISHNECEAVKNMMWLLNIVNFSYLCTLQ